MTLTKSHDCPFEIDPEKLAAALEGQLITALDSSFGTRLEARHITMQMIYGINQGLTSAGPGSKLEALKVAIDHLQEVAKELSDATASTMLSAVRTVQDQVDAVQEAAEHI